MVDTESPQAEPTSPNADNLDTEAPEQEFMLIPPSEYPQEVKRSLGGLTPQQHQDQIDLEYQKAWNNRQNTDQLEVPLQIMTHAIHALTTDPLVRVTGELFEYGVKAIAESGRDGTLTGGIFHINPFPSAAHDTIMNSNVTGISANNSTSEESTPKYVSDRVLDWLGDVTDPNKHKIISNNSAYDWEEWGIHLGTFFLPAPAKVLSVFNKVGAPVLERILTAGLKGVKVPEALARGFGTSIAESTTGMVGAGDIDLAYESIHRALTHEKQQSLGEITTELVQSAFEGALFGGGMFGLVAAGPPLYKIGSRWVTNLADKYYEGVQDILEDVRSLRKGSKISKKPKPKPTPEHEVPGFNHVILSNIDRMGALAKHVLTNTGVNLASAGSFLRATSAKNITKINQKFRPHIIRYAAAAKEMLAQHRLERYALLEELHGLSEDELKSIPSHHLAKIVQIIKNTKRFESEFRGPAHERMKELESRIKSVMPKTGAHLRLKKNLEFDERTLPFKERIERLEDRDKLSTHQNEIKELERVLKEPKSKITKENRKLLEDKLEALRKVEGDHGPTILAERFHALNDDIDKFDGISRDLETILDNTPSNISENDKEGFLANTHNVEPGNEHLTPEEEIKERTSMAKLKEKGADVGTEKQTREQIDEGQLQHLTPEEREIAQKKIALFDKLEKKFRDIGGKGKQIFRCLTRID